MLSGKLAFVTGAGSGIGRATCVALAREGARIIASDINIKDAESTVRLLKGFDHLSIDIDVSSPVNALATYETAITCFGTVPNIMVHCAGILRDSMLLQMSLEQFKDVIDVNLTGTFIMTQLACSKMVEAGIPGSVINISSIVGKRGNIGQANYSAAKAGVEALTMTAAKEMARYGIRCNTVQPGFIETPMTAGIPDALKEKFKSQSVLKRFGKPEEVAEVIAFLASDNSSYVNGACVPVNGGF